MFKVLYIFVIIELGTRKLIHVNVTDHPTAAWTLQQFRAAIPSDHEYQFLVHDRDTIFSATLDASLRKLGLQVIKTPVRTALTNAICERVVGTIRRECLDFPIPLTQHHGYRIVCEWGRFYHATRPHMSLGPGLPSPPSPLPAPLQTHRHTSPKDRGVSARSILGGLPHDYALIPAVS